MTNKQILFLSTNRGGGASEELWVQTAGQMVAKGYQTRAITSWTGRPSKRVSQLQHLGVSRVETAQHFQSLVGKLEARLLYGCPPDQVVLKRVLGKTPLALIVLNLDIPLDGLGWLEILKRSGVPFVIVIHLVSTDSWPSDEQAAILRDCLAAARTCFFVSEGNLRLMRIQIGGGIANAKIVRNPFLVDYDVQLAWPVGADLALALPARLYPKTKGQDILLEVLAMAKWRQRDIRVSLYGQGPCEDILRRQAQTLQLSNVEFRGQTDDVTSIWREHHALVLPSRQEGLPLTLVEALLCERPAIATDIAGHAEFVEDGVTGFLASAATVSHLDKALERAWEGRMGLREMGIQAGNKVRALVPRNPVEVFCGALEEILE